MWLRIDLIRHRFEDAFLQRQNRWGYFCGQLAHRAYVPTSLVTLRARTNQAKAMAQGKKIGGSGDSLPRFVACKS